MKSQALQQAVFARLNHSSVTNLLSTAYAPLPAIFTDVPQSIDAEKDSYFPYITIGGDTITPFDDKDNLGGNAIVQIDLWDRASSMLDLKALADAVDGRMRRQAMTITGVTHITTELESSVFTRDPDGKTKRGLLLYRVMWIS